MGDNVIIPTYKWESSSYYYMLVGYMEDKNDEDCTMWFVAILSNYSRTRQWRKIIENETYTKLARTSRTDLIGPTILCIVLLYLCIASRRLFLYINRSHLYILFSFNNILNFHNQFDGVV